MLRLVCCIIAFTRLKSCRMLYDQKKKKIQTVPKSLYIHLSPSQQQGKAEQSKRRNTAQPNRFKAQAQAGRQEAHSRLALAVQCLQAHPSRGGRTPALMQLTRLF